jgi:hypothetical protein
MERVARSLAPSSSVRLLARLHLYSLSSSKKETDYKIEGGGDITNNTFRGSQTYTFDL